MKQIEDKLPLQENGETVWPLSFAQERLWFLFRLHSSSAAHHLVTAFRCCGFIDYEALEWGLNQILRRHDILRTVFIEHRGLPGQHVKKGFQLELQIVELNGRNITQLCFQEAVRPFDLYRQPAIRVFLVRLGEDDHVLQLTLHHIVADGWSLGILWAELAKFYRAHMDGEPTVLPPLPLQYAQFAVQQRQAINQPRMAAQIEYWKEQYKSGVPMLELPLDRQRPDLPSHGGHRLPVTISPAIVGLAQVLGSQAGATLFMVLLAAFKVLLSRYSNQHEIVVGVPAAIRPHVELEQLIGCFVNTLALRTDFNNCFTVRELVGRVREVCLGAYTHQDLPFEWLVEELNPRRDLGRNPLFQAMFALQTAPMPAISLPGISLQMMPFDSKAAELDLSASVWVNSQGGIDGWFEYSTALFDRNTAERMMKHWQTLIQEMAFNPERRFYELQFLDATERDQLLNEWNRTEQPLPQQSYLHQRFEEQAQRRPAERALVCGNESLTYAALNQRANQLARYLAKLHVKPEMKVALCLERCPDMVVAMLAILKAGGAYVPIDPEYPAERQRFILQDCQAALLLTHEQFRLQFSSFPIPVHTLDRESAKISEHLPEDLRLQVEAETAAYVIYTSGSTGQPKGVVIPHLGLANFLMAMDRIFGTDQPGQWIAVTSMCFDISILELFWTLSNGYEVVLRSGRADSGWSPMKMLPGGKRERDLLRDMQCTPSLAMGLPDSQEQTFRKLLVGGEPLSAGVAQKLLKMSTSGVYNMYGPTETTVWSSVYQVSNKDVTVPIGRPIANTTMYVLDEIQNLVPVSVAGELYIGGKGLARGYLNRPELTAERFVPNPFAKENGERLYRTGDRGRWRADGNLEFLGRTDQQVKIRGYRIEPGEVEAALKRCPGIIDAAVVALQDSSGRLHLVAYVVSAAGQGAPIAELQKHLGSIVPEYMIPSRYVKLERLPLNPGGKLNRTELPAPEWQVEQSNFVGPRSSIEEILCDIWARVLGLEQVGTEDNFFELGGDSILGLQVVSEVEAAQLQMTVQQIFQFQTVSTLAAELSRTKNASLVGDNTVVNPIDLAVSGAAI